MKSKISKLILMLAVCICTIMAFTVSASACFWGYFQPVEPECLKNK